MADSPITALVASRNEGALLSECLESVAFCSKVIMVDLESTDNTLAEAKKHNVKIIKHDWVPVVEMLHADMIPKIKSDWVLILDPDERVRAALARELLEFVKTKQSRNVGIVYVPFQFYFKKKKLSGGIWGGIKSKRLLLNTAGITLSPNVHLGTTLKKDFRDYHIEYSSDNIVDHYWMSSYSQLFEKHKRYIEREGKARFEQGLRFRYRQLVSAPVQGFLEAFVSKQGYKDGITGLFLALFWGWYNYASRLSLKKYQKEHSAA